MNAAEQAAHAFCSALFAGLDGELDDHQLTILTWPGPSVRWLRGCDPEATASAILEADARGRDTAVYLSMAPRGPEVANRHPNGDAKRGGSDDVSALLGVWVDLDWHSPGAHTSDKRLPPDENAVREIIRASGLRPSLVWRSGHGLQAAWLLAEPYIFAAESDPVAARTRAGAAVRNWQLTLASHAHRLGKWQIDATGDLARVLRPAGTTNRKVPGDHRPVEIIFRDDSIRYELDDIEGHTAPQRFLDRFAAMAAVPADAAVKDVDLAAIWDMVNSAEYRNRRYLPEWLGALLEAGVLDANHRLVQVFRIGHDSGDDSATDMSLARHAADLEYDERDAVEIIMCRRLHTKAKLDKVDPRKRTDYLVRTVGKAYAEAAAARQRSAELTDRQARQLAEQDAAMGMVRRPAQTTPEVAEQAADASGGVRGLGGAVAATLDSRVSAVTLGQPEPEPPPRDPVPDPLGDPEPDADPADAPSAGPADEPADQSEPDDGDTYPGESDGDESDGDESDGDESDAAGEGSDGTDEPDDQERPDESGDGTDDGPPTAERPVTGLGLSRWGTRTSWQDQTLQRLSETMLGRYAQWAWIWRLQQRGRGAKAERRLVMRFDSAMRWPHGKVPDGYVPGMPFVTGWWAASAFTKVGGFTRALEQDCGLTTEKVKAKDFDEEFGKLLVRLWEPDDSGGSLAAVTRDGLLSYLLDYPPLIEWNEASTQGMPLLIQDEPRWSLTTPFRVLVRWADVGAHVRSHFAIATPPAVLSDMAELSGSRLARTVSQDGRWRMVRNDYFTTEEWSAIFTAGERAAQQRDEHRHGMRLAHSDRAAPA